MTVKLGREVFLVGSRVNQVTRQGHPGQLCLGISKSQRPGREGGT